ncbi:RHS repeat-associated core domain-containing protein [Yokenella regensburgei]|uniref:RHS repeat-associated core domain-containing protein n=1 Tax=Yokenella regensburgei TaxID=158877 RepID=UPI0014330E4D|nr:RHS repeat-associated core domain-containing protein [Yokenella regensburgei]QIU88441.1 RHS repeat-associated core domain-containing protein [Yokenella regensburgei]
MRASQPSAGTARLIRSGHTCLGVARPGGLILTTGDRNSSPLWSRTVGTSGGQLHTWSPWGAGTPLPGLPGFNGERPDPVSGSYHLGNGYRAYNPLLMRFNCPDNLSPFGAGGINPYAYCAGDPVNHTDPTGHLSWQGILGIVVSTIGLALAAFSAGSSIAAAGSITAAITTAPLATATGGLAVVADATGIASVATENSNPSASAVLGWVSLGTGVAALVAGIGQAGSRATARVRQRLGNLREEGLSGRGAPAAANTQNRRLLEDHIAERSRWTELHNLGDSQKSVDKRSLYTVEIDIKKPSRLNFRNIESGEVIHPQKGAYDFIIPSEEPNKVYVMPQREGVGHTSMTQVVGASSLRYAGEMVFNSGRWRPVKLEFWLNSSGHYLPQAEFIDTNLTPWTRRILPLDKFHEVEWI